MKIRFSADAADADDRVLQLLAIFAPAVAASARDPKALVAWHPLAAMARRLFPEAFAALDRAAGGAFPFSKDQAQNAHAQWTTDWLAWERSHDTEYKLKAAVIQREIAASGGSADARARLETIEAEKIESYQRRYEEYIRTARALQALIQ